jgi:fumarylacetoacetase
MTDLTHEAGRRSFVASANGHADFPIQNLPLGVFSPGGGSRRVGAAIGDRILDLAAALDGGLLGGVAAEAVAATRDGTLNGLFAMGATPRRALRAQLSDLLAEGSAEQARLGPMLHEAAACTLHLPARIGDYTDFYAGIRHATNVGALFRPETRCCRTTSMCRSAITVAPAPSCPRAPRCGGLRVSASRRRSPSPASDRAGTWTTSWNSASGSVPAMRSASRSRSAGAAGHIAGYALLNDWSARDIQGWEYQPLGPFLAKNFGSTISPWVITPEALEPFRMAQPARPDGIPGRWNTCGTRPTRRPARWGPGAGGLADGAGRRAPFRLSLGDALGLYWTPAQMVAHHSCGGCNLQPGDLFGTGTISTETGFGSLLEITQGGRNPLALPSGATRRSWRMATPSPCGRGRGGTASPPSASATAAAPSSPPA